MASSAMATPAGVILNVPGLGGSGPDHWQSRWEQKLRHCSRISLGDWSSPTRHEYIAAIDRAVRAASRPIVLVGHSLGCLAIAWWAASAPPILTDKIAGSLLVAPADAGQQGADLRILQFAPAPASPLRFRSLVVASANDRFSSLARSRAMADSWGASFADVGRRGHINADSGIDDWPEGQTLLADLMR